jgi:sugar/nucleoside kinase (ribokinase family)
MLHFFVMKRVEFLAIGDAVVDEFIELEDASVHCDIDNDHCTISMRWGDKIPFKNALLVAGVGNSANAAVSASRLGLSSALLTNIGKDRDGDEVIASFKKEKLPLDYVTRHKDIPTNHHYVLSFDSERTILVKHEAYPYAFPRNLPPPKTLYLSSLRQGTEAYHEEIAAYLQKHPDIFVVFQPGTFQMKLGTEKLKHVYEHTNLFVVNKEEAERILKLDPPQELSVLFAGLHALGPKMVIITDGREGAYASDGTTKWFVPMYPDARQPKERTGAGDAFSSTVAAALTLDLPLTDALRWAPINSMSVVQDIGAQRGLLTRKQLEEYLHSAPPDYQVRPF